MNNYVVYFAAFIMLLFGVAFYSALQGFKKLSKDDDNELKRERLAQDDKNRPS